MDANTDTEVLRTAVEWLDQGDAVALVTVADTWGSAPRRPGALMAVHAEGRFVGSVSGGCVEDDLVQGMLRGEFEHQSPRLITYGIDAAAARKVGLPCGGRLQLVVEYLDSAQPLREVLNQLEAHRRIARRVCLNTGEASLHAVQPADHFAFSNNTLVKVFGPCWRMLIIGAGDLTRRVARLALSLDYAVTICDSRPEYATDWSVEGAIFTTMQPVAAIDQFAPDRHSVVLSLAHAPALEDDALAAALAGDAFYVGALGSRKNHQARIARLRDKGLDDQQIQRLHGPVGLAIGSHTPAEIAIAIAAELVQLRNRHSQTRAPVEAGHA